MPQRSLINDVLRLSGVMAAVRGSMRDVAGAEDSEGRKLLVERINEIAQLARIKLTGGNASAVSKATLDKWLSPSDHSHQPSLLALLAFCKATNSLEPLRMLTRALGVDIMTPEDRKLRDYGKAVLDEKEARQRKQKLEKEL